MQHTIQSIGTVASPYKQKFGVARQPGLVPAAEICITLHADLHADSIRGLETFDYLWVHFIFHEAIPDGWSPLVRPPRLGGKQKIGVFATRSPHRPNHLGLSLLKLERIEIGKNIQIWCSGADLMDGTPIIDIKPYLPFVEAHPQARSGFVTGAPPTLTVVWAENSGQSSLSTQDIALIEQSIAQDPRPAYQNIPERIYVMSISQYEVKFTIHNHQACIQTVSLRPD